MSRPQEERAREVVLVLGEMRAEPLAANCVQLRAWADRLEAAAFNDQPAPELAQ